MTKVIINYDEPSIKCSSVEEFLKYFFDHQIRCDTDGTEYFIPKQNLNVYSHSLKVNYISRSGDKKHWCLNSKFPPPWRSGLEVPEYEILFFKVYKSVKIY